MAQTTVPLYRCDTPGCKSTCQLDPAAPDHDAALVARGWTVTVKAGSPDKEHHCPGCAAARKAADHPGAVP